MTARQAKWFDAIPNWMPICTAILSGAVWIGKFTQGVSDHLQELDKRMTHVEQYMEAGRQAPGTSTTVARVSSQ